MRAAFAALLDFYTGPHWNPLFDILTYSGQLKIIAKSISKAKPGQTHSILLKQGEKYASW